MILQEENLEFGFARQAANASRFKEPLVEQLESFDEFGKSTRILETPATAFSGRALRIPTYVNEFWTAKQRAANSLHEVSYRACFKPQLPRFFINRLTERGEVVYDPFMGRGTTLIESGLLGRVPYGCDINPLSLVLTRPRLHPPELAEVAGRIRQIDLTRAGEMPDELLAFYHPGTLREICALREYLLGRAADGKLDRIDEWIGMVALNRLTGHSPGFFSVYTLPPNQAVSVKAQRKINQTRGQEPPRKHVAELICRKTQQLLSDCDATVRRALAGVREAAKLLTGPSSAVGEIPSGSVSLVVTSPPFLDVVDYATDNWLRCWFIGVKADAVKLTVPRKLEEWQEAMTAVCEVRGGKIKLEEAVLPCGVEAGLKPLLVVINDQKFTKTANCWGVDNHFKGTNTNRIVIFQKDPARPS